MILKLYVRKKLFHLPRNQKDLTDMVKETFYSRKPLVKSGFSKMYPISDVENKNVEYEKSTNIFLLNLYLLVLQYKEELPNDSEIPITLSDENIINELSKMLDEDFKNLSIEDLEQKIDKYISSEKESVNEGSGTESSDPKIQVEFSLDWVKAMDKRIKE